MATFNAGINLSAAQPVVTGVKIYRNHRCASRHRSARTFLKCAIPRACWIAGKGNYALIAWCRVPSVSLWESLKEADSYRKYLNEAGCGGKCNGRHEVVYIEI